MNAKTLLVLICIIAVKPSLAAIRYVTVAGAGSKDGSNWSNAASGNNLQAIINASGVNDQVWVASGTYFTTSTTNRAIYISMKNGVSIYGGFVGTETLLSQRNILCGPGSILSGEIGVTGITDNSYHVISNSSGLNNSAVLDGFVIRDANDNRPATASDGLGGGIYNNGESGSCNPTIRNCVIINNYAAYGAGIFNNGTNGGNASPIITNCIIANNVAYIGGGGIDNFGLAGNASPTISNCVIYNNSAAQRAGAMYCWGGNNGNANPIIQNSAFVNNTAIDGGGVVSDKLNAGAGSSGNSNPVFTNSIVWGNSASGVGPQFFILGGATFGANYSDIDLTGQQSPHIVSGSTVGNITVNPQFVNIASAVGTDGCWLSNDDGLRLQNTSPAINAGSNTSVATTDIVGNTRVEGGTVDMGPYENSAVITSVAYKDYQGFTLYPNPAADELNVLIEKFETEADVLLINGVGKTVYQTKSTRSHEVINVSHLSSGVYLLMLVRNGSVQKIKWLKD